MESSIRKCSENTRVNLKKIALLLEEYVDDYTEEMYMKEEEGLIEFILSNFTIRTNNYYERIFAIFIDDEWIEIHPLSIHTCLEPLIDLMNKEYPWTTFYHRCVEHQFQNFTNKLSWAILQKFITNSNGIPRLSSNKALEILMENLVNQTKSSMKDIDTFEN